MKVGFIGLGRMGGHMCSNVIKAGFETYVSDLVPALVEQKVAEGAIGCKDNLEVAANMDIGFTMLPNGAIVEAVMCGPKGVLSHCKPGTIIVDMSSVAPGTTQKMAKIAAEHGVKYMDAPVSGGTIGAQKGTLAIMVGGDRDAFDKMHDVFAAMGTNIRYQGGAGCGQHTKMANQIAISGCVAAVCEAIAYAKRCGLDPQDMFDAISTGAAGSWQLTNNGQKIINGDYAPGFYVKHFIKDMNIALDEAQARDLDLTVLHMVRDKYDELAAQGGADEGTQALIKVIDK